MPSYYSTEMEEHMSGQAAAVSVKSRSSAYLRSSTWARDVKVEITRIEHQLRIALVSHHSPEDRQIGEAIRAHLQEAEDMTAAGVGSRLSSARSTGTAEPRSSRPTAACTPP